MYLTKNDDELVALADESIRLFGAFTFGEKREIYICAPRKIKKLHITLAHEMTHLIYIVETKDQGEKIPTWIHEGLAVYEEGKFDDTRLGSMNAYIEEEIAQGRFTAIRDLAMDPSTFEAIDSFYIESMSIVSFMVDTYGMNKLMSFSQKLKDGQDIDSAIKNTYSPKMKSVDDFEKQWIDSIKK